mmetsp:Transcript_19394/g.36525  ORF Transcript_19394/g.36525 Transcript_19394/m.36525 type:complete len:217 (-) Transcript_19394:426-1076(-)
MIHTVVNPRRDALCRLGGIFDLLKTHVDHALALPVLFFLIGSRPRDYHFLYITVLRKLLRGFVHKLFVLHVVLEVLAHHQTVHANHDTRNSHARCSSLCRTPRCFLSGCLLLASLSFGTLCCGGRVLRRGSGRLVGVDEATFVARSLARVVVCVAFLAKPVARTEVWWQPPCHLQGFFLGIFWFGLVALEARGLVRVVMRLAVGTHPVARPKARGK